MLTWEELVAINAKISSLRVKAVYEGSGDEINKEVNGTSITIWDRVSIEFDTGEFLSVRWNTNNNYEGLEIALAGKEPFPRPPALLEPTVTSILAGESIQLEVTEEFDFINSATFCYGNKSLTLHGDYYKDNVYCNNITELLLELDPSPYRIQSLKNGNVPGLTFYAYSQSNKKLYQAKDLPLPYKYIRKSIMNSSDEPWWEVHVWDIELGIKSTDEAHQFIENGLDFLLAQGYDLAIASDELVDFPLPPTLPLVESECDIISYKMK